MAIRSKTSYVVEKDGKQFELEVTDYGTSIKCEFYVWRDGNMLNHFCDIQLQDLVIAYAEQKIGG